MELKVKESVYEPMEDSTMLLKEIKTRANGKVVLDMGTGSGIQAITAAKAGAKEVWAADINPKAVECAKENVVTNKVEVNIIESNLFENVPDKKFDLIVFNPPYLPSDGLNDDLRWSGGMDGIEIILEFFSRVGAFMSKGAEVLFIYSSHADPDRLKRVLGEWGFKLKVITKKHIFFEDIYLSSASRNK